MDDVIYQENMFAAINLLLIYSWIILIMSDFTFLQGEGTPQFVILQGGGTCG